MKHAAGQIFAGHADETAEDGRKLAVRGTIAGAGPAAQAVRDEPVAQLSLSRNEADGDDLCHAALERVLKARGKWQTGTRLDSRAMTVMRNIWIDEVRARRRRAETFVLAEAGDAVGDAGDRRIEAAAELDHVDRALTTLPEEQREAIALVLVEGFAYREAAEILDIPIGTLSSRLVRGREALMQAFGGSGMTTIDAATRMAYVDGELDEVARRRVERAMAEDPVPAEAVARDRALRERLQAGFAPYAEEPAPDRFRALLDTNAVPVAGPSRAATWPAAARRWAQAATIAATLILGVAIGYPLSAPGPVAIRSGALVAHGRLAAALDSGISPGPQLERVPQPTAKPPLAF